MGSVKNALLPIFQHSDIIFPPDFQLKTFALSTFRILFRFKLRWRVRNFCNWMKYSGNITAPKKLSDAND